MTTGACQSAKHSKLDCSTSQNCMGERYYMNLTVTFDSLTLWLLLKSILFDYGEASPEAREMGDIDVSSITSSLWVATAGLIGRSPDGSSLS